MTEKRKNLFSSEAESFVLFNDETIRRERHNDERYFSVVDIVGILTGSADGRNYRKVLKFRLKQE